MELCRIFFYKCQQHKAVQVETTFLEMFLLQKEISSLAIVALESLQRQSQNETVIC